MAKRKQIGVNMKEVNFEEKYLALMEKRMDDIAFSIKILDEKIDKKFEQLDERMDKRFLKYDDEITAMKVKLASATRYATGYGAGAGAVGSIILNLILFAVGKFL
jgi:hypothetical protein